MRCPKCYTDNTTKKGKTKLGYQVYKCKDCSKKFNERTGTEFNDLHFPTDLVLLVVRWYLRYKLSLRDIAEIFLERGFEFTHETVRCWVQQFSPLITEVLRNKRRGSIGKSLRVDETYVKIKGKFCYLYRAIDKEGNLVDSMLSETRDKESAIRFFEKVIDVCEEIPKSITTDGNAAYPPAIAEVFGSTVNHRTNKYLNNLVEQSHRVIKQRYYTMLGFGSFDSANKICICHDEIHQFFKKRKCCEKISLKDSRALHSLQISEFNTIFLTK